jgi:hypothetical protein
MLKRVSESEFWLPKHELLTKQIIVGVSGEEDFCRVCGQPGRLYVCETEHCNAAYHAQCVRRDPDELKNDEIFRCMDCQARPKDDEVVAVQRKHHRGQHQQQMQPQPQPPQQQSQQQLAASHAVTPHEGATQQQTPWRSMNPLQKIHGLKPLLDVGALTQAEFDQKKEELLRSIK